MSVISGEVKNILFRNEENGYVVFKLNKTTCRGYLENVKVGDSLSVEGEYVNHPKYGRQFEVLAICTPKLESLSEMEGYLASGQFKGVGVATAKAIVKEFGKDTFRVIEEEPLKLLAVKRMTEDKALQLSEAVLEQKREREAFIFLQRYGISLLKSRQIYDRYKGKLYDIITQNPYKIINDIKGIGFISADEIARKVGIKKDSIERIKAGIIYCLEQNSLMHGNTYMHKAVLLGNASDLLGVKKSLVEKGCTELEIENRLILHKQNNDTLVYLRDLFECEMEIVLKLAEIDSVNFQCDERYKDFISNLEQENRREYDELQKEALNLSIQHGLFIVTGGAGVGKTTTINLLIRYFEEKKMNIVLTAPTGRASKRMADATGREAKTIHRLLEVQSLGNESDFSNSGRFAVNENNPLDADVVIVDEMSMVDMYLFRSLIRAIKKGTKLILVGDKNQLPSVGAGQIFKDLIESDCFSYVLLRKSFRQDMGGDIYINANMINDGILPDFTKNSEEFAFIEKSKNDDAFYSLTQEVKRLAQELKIHPLDVLVLSPLRRGGCGTEELNKRLQCYFNPQDASKAEVYYNDTIFREGDKVSHIKNSYSLQTYLLVEESEDEFSLEKGDFGVFNGEVGFIYSIDKHNEEVLVVYDDFCVFYKFKELELIEHAFAQTIHKAQGSEADAVVFIVMSDNILLTKNLLYTAVTRAKRYLSIVGKESVWESVITQNRTVNRNTGLVFKIREALVC